MLEAQLASQLALAGLALRETWRTDKPRFDDRIVRTLLRLGLPLVPSFYFLLVLQQGNQFMLKELRGLGELGVYVVGYNLGLVMSLIVAGFTTAWTPFFLSFSRDPAAGFERLSRAMTYYVIAVGALTLLFFAWSRPLVQLLASNPYQGAHIVVGYSAAAYFLVGVFSLLLPPLYYARHVWAVTLIQGFGAVATVCLQFILISEFGVLGAGIGLAGGFLIVCVALFAWTRIQHATYVRIPYDWPRILAFGGVIALGALALSNSASTSLTVALGWSLAATAAILAVAWLALRPEERRTLTSSVRHAIVEQRA
ncbi:MAG: oligosaccharide flippase family protein [Gammaproteobacteria bacterium]|nr:oligosaccharide flippase family protein [Gammaproteobacteria bacterium]